MTTPKKIALVAHLEAAMYVARHVQGAPECLHVISPSRGMQRDSQLRVQDTQDKIAGYVSAANASQAEEALLKIAEGDGHSLVIVNDNMPWPVTDKAIAAFTTTMGVEMGLDGAHSPEQILARGDLATAVLVRGIVADSAGVYSAGPVIGFTNPVPVAPASDPKALGKLKLILGEAVVVCCIGLIAQLRQEQGIAVA